MLKYFGVIIMVLAGDFQTFQQKLQKCIPSVKWDTTLKWSNWSDRCVGLAHPRCLSGKLHRAVDKTVDTMMRTDMGCPHGMVPGS